MLLFAVCLVLRVSVFAAGGSQHSVSAETSAESTIHCRRCGAHVASTSQYLNVAHHSSHTRSLPYLGPDAEAIRFKNPNGQRFDIVTFSGAQNFQSTL